ncbi:MAG TPA: DUF6597 domain-containing transcriptional factor [Longimicrobiales bacterium]|jgi:hypothetical protein
MEYGEILPCPALAPRVHRFWWLRGPAGPEPEGVLPDGYPEVVLNFGDPFAHHRGGGRPTIQPTVLVAGQITRPLVIGATGRVDLLGVRFRPAGLRVFLGGSMAALTDRWEDLDGFGPWGARRPAATWRLTTSSRPCSPRRTWRGPRTSPGAGLRRRAEPPVVPGQAERPRARHLTGARPSQK